jgi:hypothetical protein
MVVAHQRTASTSAKLGNNKHGCSAMKRYSSASTLECPDAQTKLVAGPSPQPDASDLRTFLKARLFGRRTVCTDCSDLVLLCTTTWLLNRSFGGLIGLMVLSRYSTSEYLTFRSLVKVSVPGTYRERVRNEVARFVHEVYSVQSDKS